MSHKVSYYWFRITQYITSIGLFYKKVGRLWRESDCEELVGVTWRVSDYEELSVGYLEVCLTCEELVGLLSGNDGVGFRGVIVL